jgi:hypothetical protein
MPLQERERAGRLGAMVAVAVMLGYSAIYGPVVKVFL